MCEIVVAVNTQPMTGDPEIDRHRFVRGCVLDIGEDGHPWTFVEQHHPDWRIVKLPNIPLDVGMSFAVPDLGYGTAANAEGKKWHFVLDLDHPLVAGQFPSEGKSPQKMLTHEHIKQLNKPPKLTHLTVKQLVSLRKTRP